MLTTQFEKAWPIKAYLTRYLRKKVLDITASQSRHFPQEGGGSEDGKVQELDNPQRGSQRRGVQQGDDWEWASRRRGNSPSQAWDQNNQLQSASTVSHACTILRSTLTPRLRLFKEIVSNPSRRLRGDPYLAPPSQGLLAQHLSKPSLGRCNQAWSAICRCSFLGAYGTRSLFSASNSGRQKSRTVSLAKNSTDSKSTPLRMVYELCN